MDTEPPPPPPPSADAMFSLLEMACRGVWMVGMLALLFCIANFGGRASQVATPLLYGLPIATLLLLGVSLVVRWRQR